MILANYQSSNQSHGQLLNQAMSQATKYISHELQLQQVSQSGFELYSSLSKQICQSLSMHLLVGASICRTISIPVHIGGFNGLLIQNEYTHITEPSLYL